MTAEPNLTWPTLIFLLFANSVAGIQCYGRGNADQGPPRGASVVRGIRWAGASTDVQGEPHAKNGDLPSPRWRLPTRTTTHVYAKWDRMDWQTGRRAEAEEGSGQVGSADEGLRECPGGRGVTAGGREDPEARQGIAQMDWACTYPDQIGLSSARWLAGRRGEKDKTQMDDMNDVNTQPGQESENGAMAPGSGDSNAPIQQIPYAADSPAAASGHERARACTGSDHDAGTDGGGVVADQGGEIVAVEVENESVTVAALCGTGMPFVTRTNLGLAIGNSAQARPARTADSVPEDPVVLLPSKTCRRPI